MGIAYACVDQNIAPLVFDQITIIRPFVDAIAVEIVRAIIV